MARTSVDRGAWNSRRRGDGTAHRLSESGGDRKAQKFLSAFSIVWPDAAEFAQAYELLAEHRLTSGLGIPDCLVAAMSLTRKARLYTFNLKHFQVISGIDVQEPYSRQ
jgi:predicted nucleic acid-binding protein